MRFKNKKIVVTGSSSGIGKATVEELKKEGAYIIGVDRNRDNNTNEFYQVDLSDKTSIDSLTTKLPSGINGLVNSAGLPPTAHEDLVVKVNLIGLKYLTTNLIHKLSNNASIVNIASLAGLGWLDALEEIKASIDLEFEGVTTFNKKFNITGARSYFFSKEALIVWTMQNRWTWRERGIRINCVSPGPVETPILKDFLETLGERAEEDMKVMDRSGRPSDIAPVVAFLLSDDSAWIRGANIPTDGGMFQHVQMQKIGYK